MGSCRSRIRIAEKADQHHDHRVHIADRSMRPTGCSGDARPNDVLGICIYWLEGVADYYGLYDCATADGLWPVAAGTLGPRPGDLLLQFCDFQFDHLRDTSWGAVALRRGHGFDPGDDGIARIAREISDLVGIDIWPPDNRDSTVVRCDAKAGVRTASRIFCRAIVTAGRPACIVSSRLTL